VGAGAVLQVPLGLSIVTEHWVARSILTRARQPEADFLPLSLRPVPRPPQQQQQQQQQQPQQQQPQQQQQPASLAAGAAGQQQEAPPATAVAGSGRLPGPDSTSTLPFTAQQMAEVMQEVTSLAAPAAPCQAAAAAAAGRAANLGPSPQPAVAAAAAAAAAAAGAGEAALRGILVGAPAAPHLAAAAGPAAAAGERQDGDGWRQCVVARQGSEFICVRGTAPRFTGGHTGIPWGFAGVWDEPCDEAAARCGPLATRICRIFAMREAMRGSTRAGAQRVQGVQVPCRVPARPSYWASLF
jgi:hypothetical protein